MIQKEQMLELLRRWHSQEQGGTETEFEEIKRNFVDGVWEDVEDSRDNVTNLAEDIYYCLADDGHFDPDDEDLKNSFVDFCEAHANE